MVRSVPAGPAGGAGWLGSRGVAGDAGQVVPLAGALMVLVVAALAGAAEGEDAARRLAVANGAELISFRREADEVVVRVRVGAVEAEARARGRRAVPGVDLPGSSPSHHRGRPGPSIT